MKWKLKIYFLNVEGALKLIKTYTGERKDLLDIFAEEYSYEPNHYFQIERL